MIGANVRNAGNVDASARAGWADASMWEEVKRKGDLAIEKAIDTALHGTSVTVVLVGARTASRRWVRREIEKSIARGSGLLGIRIHNIADQKGNTDVKGEAPPLLDKNGYPVYTWDRNNFGKWVEQAAVRAGKPCLKHGTEGCRWCR